MCIIASSLIQLDTYRFRWEDTGMSFITSSIFSSVISLITKLAILFIVFNQSIGFLIFANFVISHNLLFVSFYGYNNLLNLFDNSFPLKLFYCKLPFSRISCPLIYHRPSHFYCWFSQTSWVSIHTYE